MINRLNDADTRNFNFMDEVEVASSDGRRMSSNKKKKRNTTSWNYHTIINMFYILIYIFFYCCNFPSFTSLYVFFGHIKMPSQQGNMILAAQDASKRGEEADDDSTGMSDPSRSAGRQPVCPTPYKAHGVHTWAGAREEGQGSAFG